MTGGRTRVALRRARFEQALEDLRLLASDAAAFAAAGGPWAGAAWKHHMLLEMLAVRAYTEWEGFSHDLFILHLAKDTSQLATETGLAIRPRQITTDMAEALLTARGYLEFKGIDDLKGKARKWLTNSPFDRLLREDEKTANALQDIRNFVVHRSRQSARKYEKLVGTPVLRPGDFLGAGSPSRLDAYVATLIAAAGRLA
jgi:hypothetical protein